MSFFHYSTATNFSIICSILTIFVLIIVMVNLTQLVLREISNLSDLLSNFSSLIVYDSKGKLRSPKYAVTQSLVTIILSVIADVAFLIAFIYFLS